MRMRLAVVAALVIGVAGLPAHAAGPRCGAPSKAAVSSGWRTLAAPAFPATGSPADAGAVTDTGYRQPRAVVPDPAVAGRLLAADASTVMESRDSGCSWKRLWDRFAAPDPVSYANAITDLVVAPRKGKASVVYLVLGFGSPLDGPGPFLLRSDDGGRTYVHADTGLPPGEPVQDTLLTQRPSFTVAPSDPYVLYWNLPRSGGLYGSDDGGATWLPRQPYTAADYASDAGNPVALSHREFTCCAVDPGAPHDLWAATAGGVLHSKDGGKTFVTAYALKSGQGVVNGAVSVSRSGSRVTVMFQRADQSGFVEQRATTYVDEARTGFHFRDLRGTDEMLGFMGLGRGDDDVVGCGQHGLELRYRHDFVHERGVAFA